METETTLRADDNVLMNQTNTENDTSGQASVCHLYHFRFEVKGYNRHDDDEQR